MSQSACGNLGSYCKKASVVDLYMYMKIQFTLRNHLKLMGFILTDESDGNYEIQRSGPYDPYELTVSDVKYTDRGFYYCCLPSNCSDNVEANCQRFILRVRGKSFNLLYYLLIIQYCSIKASSLKASSKKLPPHPLDILHVHNICFKQMACHHRS